MATILQDPFVEERRNRADKLLASADQSTKQQVLDLLSDRKADWGQAKRLLESAPLDQATKASLFDVWSSPWEPPKPERAALPEVPKMGTLDKAKIVGQSVLDKAKPILDKVLPSGTPTMPPSARMAIPQIPTPVAAPRPRELPTPQIVVPNQPVTLDNLTRPEIIKPAPTATTTPVTPLKVKGIYGNALVMEDGSQIPQSPEKISIFRAYGHPDLKPEDMKGPVVPPLQETPTQLAGRIQTQETAATEALRPEITPSVPLNSWSDIAKSFYSHTAELAGRIVKRITASRFDPNTGSINVPAGLSFDPETGMMPIGDPNVPPVSIKVIQSVPERLEAKGMAPDVGPLPEWAKYGMLPGEIAAQFIAAGVPWSAVSRTLAPAFGIEATGIGSSIVQRLENTLATSFVMGVAEGETPGSNKAEDIAKTMSGAVVFHMAVEAIAGAAQAVPVVKDYWKWVPMEKLRQDLGELLYRKGKADTPAQAEELATAIINEEIRKRGGWKEVTRKQAKQSRAAVQEELKNTPERTPEVPKPAEITAPPEAVESTRPPMPPPPQPSPEIQGALAGPPAAITSKGPDVVSTVPITSNAIDEPDKFRQEVGRKDQQDIPGPRWHSDRDFETALSGSEYLLDSDDPEEATAVIIRSNPSRTDPTTVIGAPATTYAVMLPSSDEPLGPFKTIQEAAKAAEEHVDSYTKALEAPKPALETKPESIAAPPTPKPVIPKPKKEFQIRVGNETKPVAGIYQGQAVTADGTTVTKPEAYIKTLKQYGYPELSDEQFESLKTTPEAVAAVPPAEAGTFKVGDRVEITDGPDRGQQFTVEEIRPHPTNSNVQHLIGEGMDSYGNMVKAATAAAPEPIGPSIPSVPLAGRYSVRRSGAGQYQVINPQGKPVPRPPFDNQEAAQKFADGMQKHFEEMTGGPVKPAGGPELPKPETVTKPYATSRGAKALGDVTSRIRKQSDADIVKTALSEKPSASSLQSLKDKLKNRNVHTVNPESIDDFISEMKTGEGRAAAGMDPRIVKVLGGNLYKGDLGVIAIREMMQNALDSLRTLTDPQSGNIDLVVDTHDKSIAMSDNGTGMLPDVATKELLDIGGSKKAEGSSGGFGIAKVAIFANAQSISITTVAKDKDGKVWKTTLNGSGEDWANHETGLAVESLQVANDRSTGTRLKIVLNPDVTMGSYYVSELLRKIQGTWNLPYGLGVTLNGNQPIAPDRGDFQKVTSFDSDGATADLYIGNQQIVPEYGLINAKVLSNGLYQFDIGVGSIPGGAIPVSGPIVLDIHPKATPEEKDYPFSPDRERLRDDKLKNEVALFIKENVIGKAIGKEFDRYRAVIEAAPIVGTNDQKLVDTSGTINPEFVRELSNRPYLRNLTDRLADGLRYFIDGLNARRESAVPSPEFGIGLGSSYLGINIHGKSIGQSDNLLLINPYIAAMEVANAIKSGMIDEYDRGAMIAGQMAATLIHEISHQLERGHDESFAGELTRNIGRVSGSMSTLVAELETFLQEDSNAALTALTVDLGKLQNEWGGADIFRKVSAGFTVEGEPSGAPSDSEPGGEGRGRSGESLYGGGEGPASFMAASTGPESGATDITALDDDTRGELLKLGAYQYQETPDFDAWSTAMRELGDWVEPYLATAFDLIDNVAVATGKKPAPKAPQTELPKPPEATGTPRGPPQEERVADLIMRYQPLYTRIYDLLRTGTKIDNPMLREVANEVFGGTRGQGTYDPKEAYDVVEAAINALIATSRVIDLDDIPGTLQRIREITDRIPRQTDRTEEGIELQQFSTPPEEALAVVIGSGIKPGLRVLEPSAGTGNIASIARLAGGEVLTNEISPRRRALLEMQGFRVFDVDAQYLNNLLPTEIEPDIVVMNPPFSSTGGRTAGHNTMYGAEHVTQALARLKPGGRLVAVVGRGMAHGRENFDKWWQNIEQRYNVRANIGIDGKYYGKYGTGFDNQILVIDKTGATPGTTRGDKLQSITRAENLSPEQAIDLLKNLGAEDIGARIQLLETAKQGGRKPAPEAVRGPGGSQSPATTGTDLSRPEGRPDRNRLPTPPGTGTGAEALGPVDNAPAALPTPPTGGTIGSHAEGELAGTGGRQESGDLGQPTRDVNAGRTGGGRSSLTLDEQKQALGESDTDLHNKYVIQKARFKDTVVHPADIVESAVLASVEPPAMPYKPNLPDDVIKEGRISDVQLEAVAYAGLRHSQMLPSNQRAGFWIGDGTGVGKGRTGAAIIFDNYRQGRKKAVWFSVSHQLRVDAQRDLDGVGVPMKLIAQQDLKDSEAIDAKEGVLFTTYGLASKAFDSDAKRFDQIMKWLGDDFDGVILFDESHTMKNAVTTGIGGQADAEAGTLVGKMGLKLDERLPNARIVYVSATAATVPRNMGYMGRLGMWGAGSPFPNFMDFLSAIGSGGVGAMEMLARDLKATGSYVSRLISYKGINYGKITHTLTPEETEQYNRMADIWIELQKEFDTAAANAGQMSPRAKAARQSAFYSGQQRFFLQVMMGYQLPDLFKAVHEDLDAGRSVVISLYNTNEGQVKRKVAEAEAAGIDLDELDLTPRELIADLIKKSFPVEQYTVVKNSVTGKDESVPLKDENDNPVLNRENLQKREELIDKLTDVRVPDNTLDAIVNHFGAKNVSEVSGRQKRLEGNQYVRRKIKDVPIKERDATEVKRFQEGTVRVIVITGKASTGISLHADKTAANKQRRVFYAMQLSWSADKQMQSFGRVHRSSQEQPPIIKMVQTNLKGQERLTNTVASRLASLGAITEGSRESKGGELFSTMDITDQYGEGSLMQLWRDAIMDRVPGIVSGPQLLERMGVLNKDGNLKDTDATNVERFLNRILGLHVDEQNAMFEHFYSIFGRAVERARESGTFDTGVEKIDASNIKMVSDEQVYKHSSGAKTSLVALDADFPLSPMSWNTLQGQIQANQANFGGVAKNNRSGHVYAGFLRTSADSGVTVVLYRPKNTSYDHNVNLTEWRNNFTVIPDAEAQPVWSKEFEASPKKETRQVHLITGAVFPIYDKVFEGSTYGHRVVRATTTDGTPYIGIRMAAKEIPNLKQRLGIGTPLGKATPIEIYQMVSNRAVIELDNGWELRMTFVHGEPRMELDPKTSYNKDELANAGLIQETIDYKKRFFIPLDDEAGPDVLNKVLNLHKAVRDKTTADNKPKQTRQGLPPSAPPSPSEERVSIPAPVSGPSRSRRSAEPQPHVSNLPKPPITVEGRSYESTPAKIVLGNRSVDTTGWSVAPGLVITESVGKPGQFVVTHAPSGLSISTKPTIEQAIGVANRIATIGDWTRSSEDILADKAFKDAVAAKLSGETGALKFWAQKAPPPIQPNLIPSQTPENNDPWPRPSTSDIWTEIRNFPASVYRFIQPAIYNADIQMWPIFAERIRRAQEMSHDAAGKATDKIKDVLKGLAPSEFDVFQRIIYFEDMYETATTEGEDRIPLQLSSQYANKFDQMDAEIARLQGIATPATSAAVDRHHQWMEEVFNDLVARGKVEPNRGRVKYFPNMILRFGEDMPHLPGLPLRMATPKRLYLKERKGHTQFHNANYVPVMEQYGTRVYLHNMIDDFIQQVAKEYDLRYSQVRNSELPRVSTVQLTAMLATTGGELRPDAVYTTPTGEKFKTYQFEPGRVLYPIRALNDSVIQDALDAGIDELVVDIDQLRQALSQTQNTPMPTLPSPNPALQTDMGETLTHPAVTLGKQHKMFLLPIEVTERLKRFREQNQPNPVAEVFRVATKAFKMAVLNMNVFSWQGQNIFSNYLGQYLESMKSLANHGQAKKLLKGKLTGPQYDRLLELIHDARIWDSSFVGTGGGVPRALNAPELRQFRPQSSSTLARMNPFGENVIGDLLRAYETKLRLIEAVPKVAYFLENYDRVQRGLPVKVTGVSTGGLKPDTLLAVGRTGRNLNVDYGTTSRPMQFIQGTLLPFSTFYIKIVPIVLRAATHKGLLFPGDEFLVKILAIYLAAWLWNHMMYPEIEDKLDWQKEMLHLNTGLTTDDGKPYIWGMQTPEDIVAEWGGLHTFGKNMDRVLSGQWTIEMAAKQQLEDILGTQKRATIRTAPGAVMERLLNPAINIYADLKANRDSFTGQEIVSKSNPNLWGDLNRASPNNPDGISIQRQYLAKKLFSPYMQFLRASQMTDADQPIWNWITETGPLAWRKLFGIRVVNSDATQRAEWYAERNMEQSLFDSKMLRLKDLYLALDRGDIDQADLAAGRKAIDAQPGITPSDTDIGHMMASSEYQIQLLRQKLQQTSDPAKRKELNLQIQTYVEKIDRENYKNAPRMIKPTIGLPPVPTPVP